MFQVLVAEDEIWIRKAIVEMVEKLYPRFSVIGEASDGKEAWEMIQVSWPSIVVTDIMMPGEDGIWLCEQINTQQLPIVVMIVSGYDVFDYARQAMRYGVTDYLLKPVDEQELQAALEHSVERLLGMSEMRETIRLIQTFLDHFVDWEQQRILRETEEIVGRILESPGSASGFRKSLLGILSVKLNEMISGVHTPFEPIPLPEGDEKEMRSHFLHLAECWIAHSSQYANQNVKAGIRKVCDYIEKHYADELPVSEMAEMAYLSLSYFSTLFKKATGLTYSNYLNQIRVDKAKGMLLQPDLKIYEVAEHAGYSSLPYFNRVFKQIAGMTPQEYRKRMGL